MKAMTHPRPDRLDVATGRLVAHTIRESAVVLVQLLLHLMEDPLLLF